MFRIRALCNTDDGGCGGAGHGGDGMRLWRSVKVVDGDAGEVFVVEWAFSVGRVIVLVRGILVHGVVRGLLGTWPRGSCGYNMGISLLFLSSTYSSPPIADTY